MNIIEVKGISKIFKISKKQMKKDNLKSREKKAVNNLSFNIKKGKIYGLLGPNGAGKTTTLRCITTLVDFDGGDILYNGKSLKDDKDARKKIGFLTGEVKLDENFTPNYLFDMFGRLYEMDENQIVKRKKELFKLFDIEKFSEVKVGKMSTGMKQKLSIAVSIMHNPEVIIFDEPTNGLDIITAKTVTDFLYRLKEEGTTVILTTHLMYLVEKLCDEVGIIIDGKMQMEGTLEEVYTKTSTNNMEDAFFETYYRVKGRDA